jgi:hypothetical protein
MNMGFTGGTDKGFVGFCKSSEAHHRALAKVHLQLSEHHDDLSTAVRIRPETDNNQISSPVLYPRVEAGL